MPSDQRGRSDATEWVFAALNSVEMAGLPWSMSKFMGHPSDTAAWKFVDDFLKLRLKRLEPVLAGREWLAGSFSVADILMADVLRVVDRFRRAGGQSRLPRLRRARHRPSGVRKGACRPDGAFRGGRCGARDVTHRTELTGWMP